MRTPVILMPAVSVVCLLGQSPESQPGNPPQLSELNDRSIKDCLNNVKFSQRFNFVVNCGDRVCNAFKRVLQNSKTFKKDGNFYFIDSTIKDPYGFIDDEYAFFAISNDGTSVQAGVQVTNWQPVISGIETTKDLTPFVREAVDSMLSSYMASTHRKPDGLHFFIDPNLPKSQKLLEQIDLANKYRNIVGKIFDNCGYLARGAINLNRHNNSNNKIYYTDRKKELDNIINELKENGVYFDALFRKIYLSEIEDLESRWRSNIFTDTSDPDTRELNLYRNYKRKIIKQHAPPPVKTPKR